ncbi:DNA-directed RNA polymerase subunit beta' [Candidatus Berkelbacteria bacterium]|nr:DNA-directed RNA polymerase subunit beta' [Candidatus Berkelbacteria bacterium]
MSTRTDKLEFNLLNFEGLRIRVASPQDIEKWSFGEVLKPETINYRTQKPERDGLFDERIFGPTKDWECYCGKYKRIRYKGVICDKCGVEVTRSSVRRERMGHIDLAVPVAHIWYVRGVPYTISNILDVAVTDVEKVVYFASFIVLSVNEELKTQALSQLEAEYKSAKELLKDSPERLEQLELNYKGAKTDLNSLKERMVISEGKFHELSLRFGNIAKVGIGAEAILELAKKVNLDEEIARIKNSLRTALPNAARRLTKRLRLVTDMKLAGLRPEWFIINKLPVLPPDLRPMVQLDGGRFASSDLNDLYRRVINRNNRLKRLMNQGAPDVIARNEKRMLQEAVDALIDNSARKTQGTTGRQPRSLSDMLRGKQGRFRQNLLGKRVDYSGRSVIVVGPNLKLDQCGLPKVMALELFKPFVISRLINEGYVHNVKNAARLIERGTPEVWEILEEVTKESHVLLNRAPTLHRLGIQAFRPLLIEGKAIQLHPLVCAAYNADFDGDQMAVHVPLSEKAKFEAREIMASKKNLLKPASGEPLTSPRLDIVFGLFYLTNERDGVKGEGKAFAAIGDVYTAYDRGELHPQAKIELRVGDERIKTTVGRAMINAIFPDGYAFVNEALDTKKLKTIIRDVYKRFGNDATAKLSDDLMALGFKFSERSGMTMSIFDIPVPVNKPQYMKQGETAIEEITKRYRRGLITADERRKLSIEKWTEIRNSMEKEVKELFDKNSSIWTMVTSGARGSSNQLVQLAGMKGLVVNPAGAIIEVPITSNYKEGLTVLEYFISTHGSRKGKSDTSLKTADAGYLTRRLVDVAQDIVITEVDCGVKEGIVIKQSESNEYGDSYEERLVGRVVLEAVKGKDGKTIVKSGEQITEDNMSLIIENGISEVSVRTVLSCKATWGVCQKCYGRDLSHGGLVEIGTAVGIVAAQAIGEPGTQLTMKTFHMGGVSVGDITSGLPRVEEIFEARPPHGAAVLSEISGKVIVHEQKDRVYIDVVSNDIETETFELIEDYKPSVKDKDMVKAKQAIATAPDKKAMRTGVAGRVDIKGNKITVTSLEPVKASYIVSSEVSLLVKSGDSVEKGAQLTEGHVDPSLSLELTGVRSTQDYLIKEVQNIYSGHGAGVNEKHIEIIVRCMFSKVRIIDGGDSTLLGGQVVSKLDVDRINNELKKHSKREVSYEQIILGITRASLQTNSFLSAASFQETTTVLIRSAIQGAVDPLRGLKENVIIGKLIPAGTGFGDFGGLAAGTTEADLAPTRPAPVETTTELE